MSGIIVGPWDILVNNNHCPCIGSSLTVGDSQTLYRISKSYYNPLESDKYYGKKR